MQQIRQPSTFSRPHRPRRLARNSVLVVPAVLAAMAPAPAGYAATPLRAEQAAASAQSPTIAQDEASASVAAIRSGRQVEVQGQRTEYAQVFANPDGTFILRQSVQPVRTRRNGNWVPARPAFPPGQGAFAVLAGVAARTGPGR
jgi:hypothetical protein